MFLVKILWEKWKLIALKIGNFQSLVIFSVLYFVFLSPIGLVISLFQDYLRIKKFPVWEDFNQSSDTLEKLKKQ